MIAKRLFDVLFSALGLLALSPLFILITIAILLTSRGPLFFRQDRVGRGGVVFQIHKFRTMVEDAPERGPQITVGRDPRITRVGKFLRHYKLDELAQLIDVFRGKMSFVGPRPEVPHFVDFYPKDIRAIILSVKPGITDRASIEFKNENTILGHARDPHHAYIHEVLPIKLKYYVDYVKERSFWGDIRIIFATLKAVVTTRSS